jgi:hypothetical protein
MLYFLYLAFELLKDHFVRIDGVVFESDVEGEMLNNYDTVNTSGQTRCQVTPTSHIFQLQYPNGAPGLYYLEFTLWSVCCIV